VKRAALADTGPLFAIADEGDLHHARALSELKRLEDERRDVCIPFPILLEAHTLILQRLGRDLAFRWLSQLEGAVFVNPTPEDYRSAIARVRTFSDQSLTLVDATVASLAERTKFPVWTFDHHFDTMRTNVWR
jgi:predicted nucleic acid-binding protein